MAESPSGAGSRTSGEWAAGGLVGVLHLLFGAMLLGASVSSGGREAVHSPSAAVQGVAGVALVAAGVLLLGGYLRGRRPRTGRSGEAGVRQAAALGSAGGAATIVGFAPMLLSELVRGSPHLGGVAVLAFMLLLPALPFWMRWLDRYQGRPADPAATR